MAAEEVVVAAGDARVALYRGVADPDLLRTHGLFIAEGRTVVRRLLADPRWVVRSLLVNRAASRDLEAALAGVRADLPVFVCETADFLGITGHDMHRGCLALVERPSARPLEDVIHEARLV